MAVAANVQLKEIFALYQLKEYEFTMTTCLHLSRSCTVRYILIRNFLFLSSQEPIINLYFFQFFQKLVRHI